jgi:Protein of unknown function (DUF2721)
MSIQTVAGTIQIIIAPVVMIMACAILLGGMQAQFAAINDRLRAMARERLELLRTPDGGLSNVASLVGAYAIERLCEIDAQMPRLLRRHQLVHNAVLTLYCAVLVFVLTERARRKPLGCSPCEEAGFLCGLTQKSDTCTSRVVNVVQL